LVPGFGTGPAPEPFFEPVGVLPELLPREVDVYGTDVELPSDINGLIYIPLDPAGGWKLLLARELKAARIDVDASKLIA
jgi:predicted nucleotide-binding protein